MGAISINLSGFTELRQSLLELPVNLQKKTLRRVLRKQSKRVLGRIQSVMPKVSDPHLATELEVAPGRTTSRGAVIRDGVGLPTRAELGISPDDKYYWPFALEYGHAPPGRGTVGADGKKRKKKATPQDTPPHPHIRRSWDELETMCANEIGIDTFTEIERSWKSIKNKNRDTLGQLNRDLAMSTSEAILG